MRIKLDIPNNQMVFSTDIIVRIGDINYGGHLGNDRILTFCHEARVRFFQTKGQSEIDFLGKGIIMTDSAIIFKQEAFQGDPLKIELFVDDISSHGFDLYYKILNITTNKEVATVKTGIVLFDYTKRKVARVDKNILLNLFK